MSLNINNYMSSLKDKTLLSFKVYDENREITLDLDTATKNICIFGGTGSGKTTTICYPALFTLYSYGCPGLILDVKGGYSNLARLINKKNPDKCDILGVNSHCRKINLIAGITPYKLREFLQEIISSQHRDKYWGSNGIEDMVLLYELLKSLDKDKNPTLADLYYLFNNQYLIKPLLERAPTSVLEKVNNRRNIDNFSIFSLSTYRDSTTREQQTWQSSAILMYLRPFYEDDYLRSYFCNSEAIDFKDLIYNKNKIIVLDLPNSIYGDTSVLISQLLRAMFKDAIKTQGEAWLQANGYGKEKFTFMLVDEYQQFINENSSSSMDDNNWFDTSRGYGHINIISTQSIDSLINKTNEYYTNQLIGNCRNIIHLGTHAKYSLQHIELLLDKESAEKLKKQNNNVSLIYIGQNQERLGETSLMQTCKSEIKTMNFFISDESKNELFKFKNEKEELQDVPVFNYLKYTFFDSIENIWIPTKNPEFIIDKKLYIVTTTAKSSGFLDFNHICNKKGLEFKDVKVFSSIYNNYLPISFFEEQKFDSNTLVLFIRGGGNFKNCFFEMEEHIKIIKNLITEGVEFGIGYGHIDDNFQNIEYFDYQGITPTDLAYNIYERHKELMKFNDDEDDFLEDFKDLLKD